ncbi:helix-turn-helix domain-containing protein [Streptomyces sp. NBC_00268]|nr:helix-turn-helix domain-containing protein [Streptomyces sp. NBC_01764]MCX5189324.1 helix-turn-helix domain-containing protein [Streptomyces sp. NBC_00268]
MDFEIRKDRKPQGRKKLTLERAAYFQLMQQGYSSREACRIVGIDVRTGKKWRNGRHAHKGREKAAPPIYQEAPPSSGLSRYLGEADRIHIADRLREKATVRAIAAELGRSPSTISREIRRNRHPVNGQYRPHAAHARLRPAGPAPSPGRSARTPNSGASSTLGTFLRSFTHGHALQLHAVHRRFLRELAAHTPLLPGCGEKAFIDVDSTHKRVYGRTKQGAEYGRFKGIRTLHPLLATICTPTPRPVIAAVRMRQSGRLPRCPETRPASRMHCTMYSVWSAGLMRRSLRAARWCRPWPWVSASPRGGRCPRRPLGPPRPFATHTSSSRSTNSVEATAPCVGA